MKLFISLFFPNVEIEIHSRQFYEKLFNRLAWDLAMWEPSQVISGQSENFSQKKVFFELDIEDEGPAPVTNAYGMGSATPFGLELEIGRGNVKLNCRESNIGTGPTINLDLAGFNLLFGAKYLSGIADHLFISAHDLQITHKLESDPEETVWLYSTEAGFRKVRMVPNDDVTQSQSRSISEKDGSDAWTTLDFSFIFLKTKKDKVAFDKFFGESGYCYCRKD